MDQINRFCAYSTLPPLMHTDGKGCCPPPPPHTHTHTIHRNQATRVQVTPTFFRSPRQNICSKAPSYVMLYRVLQFQCAGGHAGEHPQQGRQQQHPQRAAGISTWAFSTSFGSDIHPQMGDEVIQQCYLLLFQ